MTGRILRRLAAEDGQALVLAIVVTVVGLLLALGAVAYALNSHQLSVHDEQTRAAQQAADSGTQSQLYMNSNSSSLGFNLNGGPLGLTSLLDCTVPQISAGIIVGTVQVSANTSGACPSACVLSGSTCTTPTGTTGTWEPVGDETYQESEFFANAEPQQSSLSSTGNTNDVLFPAIVSIGCHTTNTSAPKTSCNQGAQGNSYSRQLTLLQPTGPLQAIEARNDVTVNSSLSSLSSILTGDVQCVGLLGLNLVCSLTNVVQQLLTGLTSLLGLGSSPSSIVAGILGNITSLGVVDGNISAGYNLSLPSTTVNVNTSTGTLLPGLGNISGVLTNLLGTLANPASLFSTFEYGHNVCSVTTATCTANPTAGLAGNPVTAIQPNYVSTSSTPCTAGNPSSRCTVSRQTFKLTTGPSPANGAANTGPSGVTYSGSGTMNYSTTTPGSGSYGVLTVTGDTSSGTIKFAGGGTYTLCGLAVDSNVTLATTGSGGVQIYIEGPGQNGCPTAATNSLAGNFVACGGTNNAFTTGGLNGSLLSGVVNPSGLQIYVQGTSATKGGTNLTGAVSSADTAVTSCPWTSAGSGSYASGLSSADPATQAYVANASSSVLQAFVLYAPGSEVNIQSSSAFEGSAIGWNVDMTALAILQDLDLGNYPLSSVISAYQPAQTVSCDNSIEALSYTQSGNPVQNYGTGASTSSGNAGDLNGC